MKKIFLGAILTIAALPIFLGIRAVFSVRPILAESSLILIEKKKSLEELSFEQKIGQLFIIGFEGKTVSPEVENLIKELHPGGILLLERNIGDRDQLKKLIDSLQKIALKDTGLPLIIAVDQEGGLISRINWIEKTPQAKIENQQQAYQIGKVRGQELKELGINLNFSPLADESFPRDFIFERSFQVKPEKIGDLAKYLILGQKEAGILTAIKHFPGYGGISFNPEEKLAELKKIPEISQFKKALEALPEIVMVSNVVYSAKSDISSEARYSARSDISSEARYKEIDENLPLAFSKKGIEFLENNLSGDFIIISDDLAQNSLLKKFSIKEIVVSPIKAGVDMLIFSGWRAPVKESVLTLKKAVENGEVLEETIDKAVSKIIDLKQKLLTKNNEPEI